MNRALEIIGGRRKKTVAEVSQDDTEAVPTGKGDTLEEVTRSEEDLVGTKTDSVTSVKSAAEEAAEVKDKQLHFIVAGLSMFCCCCAITLQALHCYRYSVTNTSNTSKVHYVVQLSGFSSFLHAIIAHRIYEKFSFDFRRKIHIWSHVTCLVLLTAGIIVRAYAKNIDVTANGSYEPNLYTLHSFLAVAALCVYLFQMFVGASLGFGGYFRKLHARIKQLHREIGMFLLTAMTAVVTCGIQQLFYRTGCQPQTDTIDLNPAQTYLSLRADCQMLNGIGLLVYAASLLASLALSTAKIESLFSGFAQYEHGVV